MGGRGSSSGFSVDKNGNPKNAYGTQYSTLFQDGDIKFVVKNSRQSEPLMETMTSGRIYAEVGGNRIIRIVQFGDDNRRNRVIEYDKRTKTWHSHAGYYHGENSKGAHDSISAGDQNLLDNVLALWHNHNKA